MSLRRRKRSWLPWYPFREMEKLRHSINEMFEDLLALPATAPKAGELAEFAEPVMDIKETDEEIIVTTDLLGMKKEDIEIKTTEDSLKIKAEYKIEKEVKKEEYVHRERSYKGFYRMIGLPAKINPEEAKATLKDGVLEIKLPKIEVVKGKKIEIE